MLVFTISVASILSIDPVVEQASSFAPGFRLRQNAFAMHHR
jgi:hypothetical protein